MKRLLKSAAPAAIMALAIVFSGCGDGNSGSDVNSADTIDDSTGGDTQENDSIADDTLTDIRDIPEDPAVDIEPDDSLTNDSGDTPMPDDGIIGDEGEPDSAIDTLPSDSGQDADASGDFVFRIPEQNALECQSDIGGDPLFFPQIDHYCVIDNTSLTAEIYIQADPALCGEWGNPTYEKHGIWIRIDGKITEIDGNYGYGGRHRNDYIQFQYDQTWYEIWHSSIGYGWRACADPDCMIVCQPSTVCDHDLNAANIAIDGCAREAGQQPGLRAICVQVNADGTLPELTDPWTTPDPYSPENMILPCPGDPIDNVDETE